MCVLSHLFGLGKAGDYAAFSSGAALVIGLAIAFTLAWLVERGRKHENRP